MANDETDNLGHPIWAWQRTVVTSWVGRVRKAFLINGLGPSTALILSDSRVRLATRPRVVLCWLLYHGERWSYQVVGHAIGRDTSTVQSAVRRVNSSPELLSIARRLLAERNVKLRTPGRREENLPGEDNDNALNTCHVLCQDASAVVQILEPGDMCA